MVGSLISSSRARRSTFAHGDDANGLSGTPVNDAAPEVNRVLADRAVDEHPRLVDAGVLDIEKTAGFSDERRAHLDRGGGRFEMAPPCAFASPLVP
jgi:hypothetical protein